MMHKINLFNTSYGREAHTIFDKFHKLVNQNAYSSAQKKQITQMKQPKFKKTPMYKLNTSYIRGSRLISRTEQGKVISKLSKTSG